jgi:hypothetical protein
MFKFGSFSSEAKDYSSAQLDRFVQENQLLLAALAWGLRQEWGESQSVLGIDLNPQPHFICCSQAAIEQLNRQVDNQIQEILGILDSYDPEKEIAMISIGNNQIKLIYFQPDPPPPDCFVQLDADLDSLIQQLEERLAAVFLEI